MRSIFAITIVILLAVIGCKKDSSPTTPAPTTGTITGKVFNATGDTAIVGAAISTNPATSSVITDATGAYSITNVSPGTYSVNVSKTGYYDGSVSVKVTAGNSTTSNVLMARVVDQIGMIKGTVTNAGGDTVIVGASITTSPATGSVTTDASGQYTITNVPVGSYTITATKSGYNAGNTAVTITTGKISSGDIKMNVIVNHAPTTPVLVSPTSGVTGQDRSLTLSWTCSDQDGDNITYDVYLDKNSTPTTKVASAMTTTNYTASNLDSAATYYWKVIAKDSKGAVSNTSIINSFSTINLGQGLVAYYPFNGNANDFSGNGFNGTVYGASLTNDRFGRENKAYNFSMLGDIIRVSNVSNTRLKPNNGITLSCFILARTNNLHINPRIIRHAINKGYILSWSQDNNNRLEGRFHDVQTTPIIIGTSNASLTNKWVFVSVTFSRVKNTANLFIDGQIINSVNNFGWNFTYDDSLLTIGGSVDGLNNIETFNGVIDDVRIFDRELSDAEIRTLYHEGGWTGN